MCGRYTLRSNLNLILEQFDLGDVPDLMPRYNIAPTQMVAAVRATETGRELVKLRWGLIPSWAKDEKIGNRLINARSETASEKPSFRTAFRRRRCLVIADGFYEWQKPGTSASRSANSAAEKSAKSSRSPVKQPYYIHMRDEQPFAFAGLWETWHGPKDAKLDSPLESCTILTTDPNELMQTLHDRMPVILPPDDYTMWLDPTFQDVAALESLQRPYRDVEMVAEPVSTTVNNPRNETPECIVPVEA